MASGEEDIDSLFEGMVLFNPSEIPIVHDDQKEQHPSPLPKEEPPQESVAALPESDALASSSTSCVSQPLDENLFSDLTLITHIQETTPSDLQTPSASPATDPHAADETTASSAPVSSSIPRQASIRKKKRAGLRIGYGRDSAITDDLNSSLPHSLPEVSPSPSVSSGNLIRSSVPTLKEVTDLGTKHTAYAVIENDLSYRTSEVGDSCDDIASTSQSDAAVDEHVPAHGEELDIKKEAAADDEHIPTLGEELDAKKEVDDASEIELKFELIKTQISEKLNRAGELVASVSAARKDSIRKRRKAAADLSLASTKHRELEKELEDACETEDFEAAERVSMSLAAVENEKERLAVAFREAEMACDAVDSDMQEALECQIVAEEECAYLLQHFASDASDNADFILKNAEALTSKEMNKWSLSCESLEAKKMGLEIESCLMQEARSILNESITESVFDDRRERELLCKQKELLTAELQTLLTLVKEKEAEISETNTNIEKIEKRIADVAASFEDVQFRIDSKNNELDSGLSRVELDFESLSKKKKDIEGKFFWEEGRGAKIRDLAKVSADEATMYEEVVGLRRSLMEFILISRQHREKLAKTEDELSRDVQMLRQEVSSARASLQELSSIKSSVQQDIESSKQRILFIEKRVPELEAEKKVAATARNFKEAARIANEAKTLCIEKEDIQAKMEGDELELGKLEKEINGIVEKLQDTEIQITTKEKELAMARYERLIMTAAAATSERSTALNLGDIQEADILLAEAEAADSEAKKLQPLNNFDKEYFTNVPKNFISVELVSSLGRKQLAELVASASISTL